MSVKTNRTLNDIVIDGNLFYGMDGKLATKKQVDLFFHRPAHFSLKLQENNHSRIHQTLINELNNLASENGYTQKGKPHQANLLMLGAGLGFQIAELKRKLSYKHIILVEPSDELLKVFKANVNVSQLKKEQEKHGGSFTIINASSYQQFKNDFRSLLQNRIGFGFLSEVSVFRHYEHELLNNILENFKEIRDELLSAWGFFEDELDGLQHTLTNIQRHKVASFSTQAVLEQQSFVVVGNGPSLDENIEALSKRKDEFIIVSCGTSLSSLLKNDITPDIHVEMERSLFTAYVQQPWLTSPALKDTILLALSTVSPSITDHFQDTIIFGKANDLGSTTVDKLNLIDLPILNYCNPTVTNFALSALLHMGIKNITLIGCDYGYRDNAIHHSKSSDYYNPDSQLSKLRAKKTYYVVDNDGKSISTTRILDLARKNIEILIKNKPQTIINCSNGAKINGTIAKSFSQVSSLDKDKERLRSDLLNITTSGFEKPIKNNEVQKVLEQTIEHVTSSLEHIVKNHPTLSNALIALTDLVCQLENKLRNDMCYVLFIGDLRYYQLLLSTHINRLGKDEQDHYWANAKSHIQIAIDKYEAKLNHLQNLEVL